MNRVLLSILAVCILAAPGRAAVYLFPGGEPSFSINQLGPYFVGIGDVSGPCTIQAYYDDALIGPRCIRFSARTEANTPAYLYVAPHLFACGGATGAQRIEGEEQVIPISGISTYWLEAVVKREGADDGNKIAIDLLCYARDGTTLLGTITPLDFSSGIPATWGAAGGVGQALIAASGTATTWPAGTTLVKLRVRDYSSGTNAVNLLGSLLLFRPQDYGYGSPGLFPTRPIWIPLTTLTCAGQLLTATTTPSTVGGASFPYVDWPGDADNIVWVTIALPADFVAGSAPTLSVWAEYTTGSGDPCYVGVDLRNLSDSESVLDAVDSAALTNAVTRYTFTANKNLTHLGPNDLLRVAICRHSTGTRHMALVAARLDYTASY